MCGKLTQEGNSSLPLAIRIIMMMIVTTAMIIIMMMVMRMMMNDFAGRRAQRRVGANLDQGRYFFKIIQF